MKQNPELEAFEAELKKYMAIETEVSNISPVYNIGKQACGCVLAERKQQLNTQCRTFCAHHQRNISESLLLVCLPDPCTC